MSAEANRVKSPPPANNLVMDDAGVPNHIPLQKGNPSKSPRFDSISLQETDRAITPEAEKAKTKEQKEPEPEEYDASRERRKERSSRHRRRRHSLTLTSFYSSSSPEVRVFQNSFRVKVAEPTCVYMSVHDEAPVTEKCPETTRAQGTSVGTKYFFRRPAPQREKGFRTLREEAL